jgi:hypothetical protein
MSNPAMKKFKMPGPSSRRPGLTVTTANRFALLLTRTASAFSNATMAVTPGSMPPWARECCGSEEMLARIARTKIAQEDFIEGARTLAENFSRASHFFYFSEMF